MRMENVGENPVLVKIAGSIQVVTLNKRRLTMSESVKVGGIGKNPAIDKINKLNAIDVKNYAVQKMAELLLADEAEKLSGIRQAPIDLSGADWEGKAHG